MSKTTKKRKKELEQPDEFQTRGELLLQHFVDNQKRYVTYLAILLAALILGNVISYFIESRNDKISLMFTDCLKVYNASVEEDAETADPAGDPPSFESDEAKYMAASAKFENLISEYGGSSYGTVAKFYLANSLFMLKRTDKAKTAYLEFLSDAGSALDEFKFMSYHNIAQCYDSENNLEKAVETYNKILTLDGETWKDEATYKIALIYKRQGKTDDAVKQLLEMNEKYPKSALKPQADKLLVVLRGPVKEEEKPEEDSKKAGEGN